MNQEQEVINLYLSGLSSKNVSDKTGISATQVRRILTKHNISGRSTKTNDIKEKEIIEKYQSNISAETIAKEMGINPSTICRILKRNNIELRTRSEARKYLKTNSNFLDIIDTEEKAYFLGFMFSDGNVKKDNNEISISLHEKDIDILYKFIDLLFINCSPTIGIDREIYRYISIIDKKLRERLIEHGCVPAKTFSLSWPKFISDDFIHHFLRGFYDGDGSLGVYNNNHNERVKVTLTGFNKFLFQVKDYLENKLNIFFSISEYKDKKDTIDIVCNSFEDNEKLLNYLYKDSKIFLKRKYDIYLKAINVCEEHLIPAINYGSSNIVSYNGQKLTHTYIKSLPETEKENVAKFLFSYFRKNGFPFEKFNDQELLNDFNKLKQNNLIINNNVINNCFSDDGLKLIKNFCHHLFEVKSKNKQSMISVFENDILLMKVIKNRLGITYKETFNITGNMLKQGLRNSRLSFATSIFRPTIAKGIYDYFAPNNSVVLDISAGFGQRMLAAKASTKVTKYIGIDPWKKQIDSLNKICEFLKLENVELYNTGSENYLSEKESIDFCFSSPPFYNKEIYCDEQSQAYFQKTFTEFLNLWWIPTFNNVHQMLKSKSLFIINMKKEYFNDMYEKCNKNFLLINTITVNYKRSHIGNDSYDYFFILEKI